VSELADLIGVGPGLSLLGAVLLIYGVLPGTTLRAILLLYPKDDPRRRELLAEMYSIPKRRERLLWVAEQLETAVFEGMFPRMGRWTRRRITRRTHLHSGTERHRQHPTTFEIPSDSEKSRVAPGNFVKLMFSQRGGYEERMWVEVTRVGRRRLQGRLTNTPLLLPGLEPGDTVKFRLEHVIDVDFE
jgi:hypothetical protein